MSRDTHIIRDFFNKLARRYGDSVHSLAWESDYTQRIRFQTLARIDDLTGMRVLDVGCGKADLYTYFAAENISVEYYGVDLAAELVKLAQHRCPPARIFLRDFLQDAYYPDIDYALASGVANVRTPDNQSYMEAVIRKMFGLVKKGAAVNMLTTYSPDSGKDPGIYYYSPELMLRFALKLTPSVVLHHGYLPNDFTLYLYKSP